MKGALNEDDTETGAGDLGCGATPKLAERGCGGAMADRFPLDRNMFIFAGIIFFYI
jgi:hypothetical protein